MNWSFTMHTWLGSVTSVSSTGREAVPGAAGAVAAGSGATKLESTFAGNGMSLVAFVELQAARNTTAARTRCLI
jgi:hypothetical protein